MAFHKELFKENSHILNRPSCTVVNRQLIQTNRSEKRKTEYSLSRNIESPHPIFTDFQINVAESSTPMESKRVGHLSIGGNKGNGNDAIVSKPTEEKEFAVPHPNRTRTKEEKELNRREAFFQRFITWKADRARQKELDKAKSKPIFTPVGKPKKKVQATAQQSPLAPKNHVFHPPDNLNDSTGTSVKRQSLYLAVPTPPKAVKNSRNLVETNTTCKQIRHETESIKKCTKGQEKSQIPFVSKKITQEGEVPISEKETTMKSVPIRRMEFLKNFKTESTISRTALRRKCILNDGVKEAGAIGKIRTVQKRMQSNMCLPVKDKNQLNRNTKLSSNLKVKNPKNCLQTTTSVCTKPSKTQLTKCIKEMGANTVPTQTPLGTGNSEKIIAAVTTMTTKTTSSSVRSHFGQVCKPVINATCVKSISNAKPAQNVAEKRSLIQPLKFNFVKEVLLDSTATESPVVASTSPPKETVIHHNPEELQNEPNTLSKIRNGEEKFKPNTRILQKMKVKFEAKVGKEKSSTQNQLTPLRSLIFERRHIQSTDVQDNLPQNFVTIEAVRKHSTTPIAFPQTPNAECENNSNGQRPMNYMSPFVSVSRGSWSVRKEREKGNSTYLQDTSTGVGTSVKSVEITMKKRRTYEALRYYRQQLNNEIQRLHAQCDRWDEYKKEPSVFLRTNNWKDMINATIMQTRLLTSKKFTQFESLLDRCEAQTIDDGSENAKTITPEDLECFWSMLSTQIENIEKRFRNLEVWKEKGWNDPDELHRRIKKNLTEVQKDRKEKALTTFTSKPRPKTALREEICNNEPQEMQSVTKKETLNLNPRPVRHSMRLNKIKFNRLRNSPARMCVVVPDRRSRSLARTVILVPSSLRSSPKSKIRRHSIAAENVLLKKTLRRCARHRRSLQHQKIVETMLSTKNDLVISPPRTRNSLGDTKNAPKSILKTPGTPRIEKEKLTFNDHLSVKKFRPLRYDDDRQVIDVEYDPVQHVHIDDYVKMRSDPELSPRQKCDDDEGERVCPLRNPKIEHRPSCEIEISK